MGLSRYENCMPIQFIDLIHWAKLRDFDQGMDQTDYRSNEHLLSLAKFLNRSVPSASSGIRANLNVKGTQPLIGWSGQEDKGY